jgi:acetyltransferase-like isoleucine patch superfamily enzyme
VTTLALVREKLARLWFSARWRLRFRSMGRHALLVAPFRIDGAENIELGEGTFVQRGGWLYCVGIGGVPASLEIGAGCVFGYNNHITAVRKVVIGEQVLTANNVYISDNLHEFADVATPIMHQPVRFKGAVTIGAGSWIGENACIIGASVGRNCVVGANAVVTRDVPDFCVVAGVPAVVIKRYDPSSRTWLSGPRA